MADGRAARLVHSIEGVAWWAVGAPVLACLPAALGYQVARWRGDWHFRSRAGKRAELERNFRRVLGKEMTPARAQRTTREWFRFASCEALDVMRLRGSGRALGQLVEIRGREHLEAALAQGKGAILCCAHFGSFDAGLSLLGASGFRVTTIGRWQHNYTVGLSSAERRFWDWVYARRLRRHRARPNIEPWPGRINVAVLAAAALRSNEVVAVLVDAPALDSDLPRTVGVPFLGGQARLVPGVVALAQFTGAPVLMSFLFRQADYAHQVLEISAPVPADGERASAFGRYAAGVSAAISASPAHWLYWPSTDDLANLGLLRPQPEQSPATAPPHPEEGSLHDGPADNVTARG